ncbi:MAG: zinc-ribbon domain-containing protein [Acidobacteriia bacterium]|nr:zinc-ribbon domain-containing protein [Terriglobia bacterium]MBV9744219.1 zinc-ribbon domain-containing protein [Terriglobia bacterium]
MPFCSQCGKQVDVRDAYCSQCGARQPVAASPPDPFTRVSPRTASIFCYVPGLGWVACIIVLAAQRFRQDRTVRFHAFQGLYLFVAWLLDDWVIRPITGPIPRLPIHGLVQAALLFMSIFMMVKAAHNEAYSLPLFGELAERSVSEQ